MLKIGEKIKQIVVQKKIKSGGFGSIYVGQEEGSGKLWALKVLSVENESDKKAMQAEISVGLTLNVKNPFLVRYSQVLMREEDCILIMEYFSDGDLSMLIEKRRAENKPFTEEECLSFLYQCSIGLNDLHKRKLVHRDLKPNNILILDGKIFKITDYSISRGETSNTVTMMASNGYMSPGLLSGTEPLTIKDDIYALGIMLLQLLCMRHPFSNPNGSINLSNVLASKMNPIDGKVSAGIRGLALRMIDLDATKRPTVDEILRDPVVFDHITTNFSLMLVQSSANQATVIPQQQAQQPHPQEAVREETALAQLDNTGDKRKGYAFRVKCRNGSYCYGKTDKDVGNVCGNDYNITAYLADSDEKTTIHKSNVFEFVFGKYSGKVIGNSFLSGCTSLTMPPTIPNTVTSIGNDFLSGCTSLTMPPTISNTVTSIGNFFLSGCTSLTMPPTIPNTVTSIGNYFLYGCTSLSTSPKIPNTVTSIGNYFLSGCTSLTTPPTIPNTVTSIGSDFLSGCTSVTTPPTISNTVIRICHHFLSGCTSLTTPPTIPNTVTSIGNYFLYGCTSLSTSPTIPNTVTSIGYYFLCGCTSLTTPPTISNTITSIDNDFLSGCTSLTTPPIIPNTITDISNDFLSGCTSLTTPPTISNTLTGIGNNFLAGCTSLTTPPTIPNTVTNIGKKFLCGCTSLTTPPTIPNTVTSIGIYFLSGCTSLTTPPRIPNTVSIGGGFLEGCTFFNR